MVLHCFFQDLCQSNTCVLPLFYWWEWYKRSWITLNEKWDLRILKSSENETHVVWITRRQKGILEKNFYVSNGGREGWRGGSRKTLLLNNADSGFPVVAFDIITKALDDTHSCEQGLLSSTCWNFANENGEKKRPGHGVESSLPLLCNKACFSCFFSENGPIQQNLKAGMICFKILMGDDRWVGWEFFYFWCDWDFTIGKSPFLQCVVQNLKVEKSWELDPINK